VLHLPLHEPSYECVTKAKDGEFFMADATGVTAVSAHVCFSTVNCFCEEMGVLGLVGTQPGVYKQENKTVLGYSGNHSV
jgi:hypothetical protein